MKLQLELWDILIELNDIAHFDTVFCDYIKPRCFCLSCTNMSEFENRATRPKVAAACYYSMICATYLINSPNELPGPKVVAY